MLNRSFLRGDCFDAESDGNLSAAQLKRCLNLTQALSTQPCPAVTTHWRLFSRPRLAPRMDALNRLLSPRRRQSAGIANARHRHEIPRAIVTHRPVTGLKIL